MIKLTTLLLLILLFSNAKGQWFPNSVTTFYNNRQVVKVGWFSASSRHYETQEYGDIYELKPYYNNHQLTFGDYDYNNYNPPLSVNNIHPNLIQYPTNYTNVRSGEWHKLSTFDKFGFNVAYQNNINCEFIITNRVLTLGTGIQYANQYDITDQNSGIITVKNGKIGKAKKITFVGGPQQYKELSSFINNQVYIYDGGGYSDSEGNYNSPSGHYENQYWTENLSAPSVLSGPTIKFEPNSAGVYSKISFVGTQDDFVSLPPQPTKVFYVTNNRREGGVTCWDKTSWAYLDYATVYFCDGNNIVNIKSEATIDLRYYNRYFNNNSSFIVNNSYTSNFFYTAELPSRCDPPQNHDFWAAKHIYAWDRESYCIDRETHTLSIKRIYR